VMSLENAGAQLRGYRMAAKKSMRATVEDSRSVAHKHRDHRFRVNLTALSELECGLRMPRVHVLRTLATIYGVPLSVVLSVYGIWPD
jgi:transcriptional regulator with XRE-family HTH domain